LELSSCAQVTGGDGKGVDRRRVQRDGAFHRSFVERLGLLAAGVVAAADSHDLPAAAARQPGAGNHGVIETDHERANWAKAILDHRIGCQRRRHADQAHPLATRARGPVGEHGANGGGDPDRKIPRSGQSLGTRDDAAAVGEQHGIGEGPAGVEPEPKARLREAH
jgi:hypothetical protein